MKSIDDLEGKYPNEHQRLLISVLLSNADLFKKCRPVLSDTLFDDELRRSMRFILSYWDDFQELPDRELVNAKMRPTGYTKLEFKEIPPPPPNPNMEYYLNEMEDFCRFKSTEHVILDGYELLNAGHGDEIATMLVEARAISLKDVMPTDISDLNLTTIEPRAWVYGRSIVRGFLTCIAGPGGAGKSSLALAIALSVASNKPLLALDTQDEQSKVWKSGPVLYWNLEDPEDEMRRRAAAEMGHRNVTQKQVAGKLFLFGSDQPLCVARMNNGRVEAVDVSHVIKILKKLNAVMLVVDPTVMTHEGLDENNNAHLNAVVAQFRKIAREANVAVLLLHHFRKGGQAGDADAARGAVALHAGCRVMETVTTMTIDDAMALGIAPSDRKSYVRKENAKANMSSSAAEGEWYRFNSVSLQNGSTEYPDGDHVGVLTRWKPQSPLHGLTWTDVETVLETIHQGKNGDYYTHAPQSKMWVGHLLMEQFHWEKEKAKVIVKEWSDIGLLKSGEYKSPVDNKKHVRLEIDQTARSELKSVMESRA